MPYLSLKGRNSKFSGANSSQKVVWLKEKNVKILKKIW
jgi:hypothetical protein